jgi:dimethylhistidine N-methyltransferase
VVRVTRTEHPLRTHADAIFSRLQPVSTVVELGPGSGEKLVTLMAAWPERDVTVHLVDVSPAALDKAASVLAARSSVTVVTHQATYEAGLSAVGRSSDAAGRVLAVFLGSNIGNFDPPGTDAFLRGARAALGSGAALLLGTDLVKPESELPLAYDDPLGVTAAFNRNLLVRVNRELDGDFDVNQFSHRAVWNGPASRVEMHLVSRSRQRVQVRGSRIDVTFDAGESIWTESSYKYRSDDLAPILDRAGFRLTQWQERLRPDVGGSQVGEPAYGTQVSARYSCTNRTTIDPSPTADATRFMAPARMSPAANTPGTLVSSDSGSRRSFQIDAYAPSVIRSRPVSTNPFASRRTSAGSQSPRGRVPMNTKTASISSTWLVPSSFDRNATRSTRPLPSTRSTSVRVRRRTFGVFAI